MITRRPDKRPMFYILRDRKALPTDDVLKWAKMFEERTLRVVQSTTFKNASPWLEIDTARAFAQAKSRASLGMTPTNIEDIRMHAARILVSTVFLGLDHNWGRGPPLLFETLIFGGPLHDEMWRYPTWDAAVAGHTAAVQAVKSALVQQVVNPVSK